MSMDRRPVCNTAIRKRLKKSDFIVNDQYHVRLREETTKRLIESIKSNFNKRVQYKKNVMYDVILLENIQLLSNYIQDKAEVLQFNIPEIQIGRDDDLETRDYILKMTPEQRKAWVSTSRRSGICRKISGKVSVSRFTIR